MHRSHGLLAGLIGLALLAPVPGEARPERIRAGVSYYSSQVRQDGLVSDLVGEKNYEEVYQLYRYYEAVYDEAGRVVRLVRYERGEVVETEEYAWGEDGRLLWRTRQRPGQPSERTEPGDEARPDPPAQSQGAMRP